MNWTKTKPTTPGWYWWRIDGWARCVIVEERYNNGALYLLQPGCEMAYRVSEWGGDWAGPIPEPQPGPGAGKARKECGQCRHYRPEMSYCKDRCANRLEDWSACENFEPQPGPEVGKCN